ncbi:MAG TPA: hypothetical protein VHA53_13260 [Nitrolancea sp.]|jgi:hypothetical protein|nr:hypothetical protein [Nitrolancea sp.]
MADTFAAITRRLPPPTPDVGGPFALGQPGRLEQLLEETGLSPVTSAEVDCDFVFPDLESALRAVLSSGMAVAAGEQIGEEPVRQAIAESFAQFRTSVGGYHQPNRIRYVIASAS